MASSGRALRWLVALTFSTVVGASARAQDDYEGRLLVARDYIGYSLQAMDTAAFVQQMSAPLLGTIQEQQPDLWREKSERLTSIVETSMEKNFRTLMFDTDKDMANLFTLGELTALRDFYASSVGRSVMGKLGAFTQEALPRIIDQMRVKMVPMLDELASEGVQLQ